MRGGGAQDITYENGAMKGPAPWWWWPLRAALVGCGVLSAAAAGERRRGALAGLWVVRGGC